MKSARLRLAACLLADVAWNAHPDFRAEWAVDMGLHGNWVGIDAEGRTVLGRTLNSAFGGEIFDAALCELVEERVLEHADRWGAAIRLAQRLSGGTASLLKQANNLICMRAFSSKDCQAGISRPVYGSCRPQSGPLGPEGEAMKMFAFPSSLF